VALERATVCGRCGRGDTLPGLAFVLSLDPARRPPVGRHPYLQEFYGSVAWAVGPIYADRVGWFDGNATRLFPLPELERAAKIIGLAGGVSAARPRDPVLGILPHDMEHAAGTSYGLPSGGMSMRCSCRTG
jgi:alkyl sulfatase-like protein